MAEARAWDLSRLEMALLRACAQGRTLRPSDHTDPFVLVIERLLQLRQLGLVRVEDGRIMKSQVGRYLMAGPCDLTDAGRRLLEQEERLGPRPAEG